MEAGACPRCPGKEAARRGVYDFIARNQVWWSYLFILRQNKQTQDSSLCLSLTCTAFQETRHMLSGQPQLEYHGAGTRYAVPDLPYKCHLCHKKFRDMGGMMQHQVWKKTLIKTKNPCNFSGLCPPCCEPKIGPSLKEESSRPKQCMKSFNVNVTEN